jgi:mutator protein MutT
MITVVMSVIWKNNKVLLLKRAPTQRNFPGLWDFPGGKLEPNESSLAGVRREAFEETSLDVEPDKLVCTFNFNISSAEVHVEIFSVKSATGTVKLSEEHTAFEWVSPNDLQKYHISPFAMKYFEMK